VLNQIHYLTGKLGLLCYTRV